MKAAIVTDALTIVGMIAIGALMFSQIPDMIDEMKDTLSKESARAQAVEIANFATLVGFSPSDIQMIHELPDGSYTVTVKDGYVTVELSGQPPKQAKTLYTQPFGPNVVKSISITKSEITRVA